MTPVREKMVSQMKIEATQPVTHERGACRPVKGRCKGMGKPALSHFAPVRGELSAALCPVRPDDEHDEYQRRDHLTEHIGQQN